MCIRDSLYKNHPAVLAWGVGNELEHLTAEADADQELVAAIWTAINTAAGVIKVRDPLHPTVAVTADMGEWHLVDNATQLATATTSAGYSALFQRPDGRVGVLWETEGDVPGCRGQGCSIAVSFL